MNELTTDEFRARLAGLTLEEHEELDSEEMLDLASKIVFALAKHFNRDELEATTLWDRIASGITTACEQVDNGDVTRWLDICLAHVMATPGAVAGDAELRSVMASLAAMDDQKRIQFLAFIKSRVYGILMVGRDLWEQRKGGAK